LLGAATLVYVTPAVDLQREQSLISVQPNQGNREVFHINLPYDRIFSGSQNGGQNNAFPRAIAWPQQQALDGSDSEIFKLRNSKDIVVGIAARISSTKEASGSFIQWMLHLPARGSIFAGMQPGVTEKGDRDGLLLAGTREFHNMSGTLQERFDTDTGTDISGRLELVASLRTSPGEAQ